MGLQNNAMLVKISIGVFSNERIDNESAEELATQHKVERYVKARRICLPEYCLDNIRRISGDIRSYHAANTLPFLDRGVRLLPSANYFSYVQGLSHRKAAFEKAVDEFIIALPIFIEEAKLKFGDRFDEDSVPSVEILKTRFYITPVFMPIADTKDWRIELENVELEKLKNQYAIQLNAVQAEATALLWKEITAALDHLITKIETPKAKIFNTLLPNINELAHVTQRLNTANDSFLHDICDSIINTVASGYDADDLKHPHTKLEILTAARAIRERVNATN